MMSNTRTRWRSLWAGAAGGLAVALAAAAPLPCPPLTPDDGGPVAAVPLEAASAAAGADPPQAAASAPEAVGRLYMADGQLVSWDLKVFVTADVPANQVPSLCLLTGHFVSKATAGEKRPIPARLVARRQSWTGGHAEDGAQTQHVGTMLLFKVPNDVIPPWKPMMRVRPLLQWVGADGHAVSVLGQREVNIGNAVPAWAMTIALVAAFAVGIVLLARRTQHPGGFLLGDDGRLSLSSLQMALWTLVIGAVVFFFGVVQLDVPDIPASLVVLMGMSLVTRGVTSHATDKAAAATATAAAAAPADAANAAASAAGDAAVAAVVEAVAGPTAALPAPGVAPVAAPAPAPLTAKAAADSRSHWHWSDLISDTAPEGQPRPLSLSRAQMLFWTLLLIILFLSKSILSGMLWEVPWELIALMGISQAGYLAPKLKT
jgi:hypothetical protein